MTACNNDPTIDGPNKEPYKRFLLTTEYDDKTLIIVDYNFWTQNEEELAKWLLENTERGLNTREGMMLYFATTEEMTWFLLRWN